MMFGIEALRQAVEEDMRCRLPEQRITQTRKLSTLIATLLQEQHVNRMALGCGLPLATENRASRFQWIKRVLKNDLIDPARVMEPYARDVLERSSVGGVQPILIIDQSQATRRHRHEMLMVAVRVGGRALPLTWLVRKTAGAIGFAEQVTVLERVAGWLPEGVTPVLMGDRFYGSPDLIAWCAARGWSWRLRLKAQFLVTDREGGETTLKDCVRRGEWLLEDVSLTEKKIRSHVAIIHDTGHEEPWIISLSERPNTWRARDYEMRWGIEALFSDLKTRGFNIEDSQLRLAERIDRLLLAVAIAVYWAVSTGMWDAQEHPLAAEKSSRTATRPRPPIPSVLVHPRSPPPDPLHRPSHQASTALDRLAN